MDRWRVDKPDPPNGVKSDFQFEIVALAFLELFELLREYAPAWYTEQHHKRASAAHRMCQKILASSEPEATDPNRKHPWQQAVADAFQSPSENLRFKVNAALRAISARLREKTPADPNEQIAIREALQSLRTLLPELSPKQSSELESGAKDKGEIA